MVLTEAGRLLQSAGLTMRHDECALKEQMGQGRRGGPQSAYGGNHDHWRVRASLYAQPFMLNEPEATVHVTVANTTDLLRSIDEGKLDLRWWKAIFGWRLRLPDIFHRKNISR